MAQVYGPFVKGIREKIRDLIKTRAAADAIHVDDVRLKLHRSTDEEMAREVFVLKPPMEGRLLATVSAQSKFRVPVLIQVRADAEQDAEDALSELESLVIDTLDANPLLGGLAGVEEASVINSFELEEGTGPDTWPQLLVVEVHTTRSVIQQ